MILYSKLAETLNRTVPSIIGLLEKLQVQVEKSDDKRWPARFVLETTAARTLVVDAYSDFEILELSTALGFRLRKAEYAFDFINYEQQFNKYCPVGGIVIGRDGTCRFSLKVVVPSTGLTEHLFKSTCQCLAEFAQITLLNIYNSDTSRKWLLKNFVAGYNSADGLVTLQDLTEYDALPQTFSASFNSEVAPKALFSAKRTTRDLISTALIAKLAAAPSLTHSSEIFTSGSSVLNITTDSGMLTAVPVEITLDNGMQFLSFPFQNRQLHKVSVKKATSLRIFNSMLNDLRLPVRAVFDGKTESIDYTFQTAWYEDTADLCDILSEVVFPMIKQSFIEVNNILVGAKSPIVAANDLCTQFETDFEEFRTLSTKKAN